MALFENFPYTNISNLNLNWIIKKIKGIEDASDLIVDIPGYAQTCEDAATAAQGYKNDASGYATAAQNSANAAAGSANDALGYKNDASGYASAAAGSANDSLGYKNDASGYATAAGNSALAAAASATEAASYTGFHGFHVKVEAGDTFTETIPDGGYILIDSVDVADLGYDKHANIYYVEVISGAIAGRIPLATQQAVITINYNCFGGSFTANNGLGTDDVYVTLFGVKYSV